MCVRKIFFFNNHKDCVHEDYHTNVPEYVSLYHSLPARWGSVQLFVCLSECVHVSVRGGRC